MEEGYRKRQKVDDRYVVEQGEEEDDEERGAPGTSKVPGRNVQRQGIPGMTGGLESKLHKFWSEMMDDVNACGGDVAEFKMQQLPLARIKKIMKSDEDVRMISAEAPVLFAKACEFFILEMTLRAWHIAEENNRRTLTRQDISDAVNRTEVWDFLADTVPAEQDKQFPQAVNMAGGNAMPESYQYMAGNPAFAGMHPMSMPMAYPPQAMFLQQQGNMDATRESDDDDDVKE